MDRFGAREAVLLLELPRSLKPTIKVDLAEFTRTMREYSRVCKSRTIPEIVNTKAYYIARRAIFETPKADANKIKGQLGKFVTALVANKRGRMVKRRQVDLVQGSQHPAPLAALIINARRGAKGLRGLYGAAMEKAARAFLAARLRSVSFLKSGWLPAVKLLGQVIGKSGGPSMGQRPKQVGQPKGSAMPARSGFRVKATIINAAGGNKNNRGALLTFGEPALQRAIDAEQASMHQYIEDHLREAAHGVGIKTK